MELCKRMEQSIRLWLQTTPSVGNSCVTCQWSLAGRGLFLTFSAAVAGPGPAGQAAHPCGPAPSLPVSLRAWWKHRGQSGVCCLGLTSTLALLLVLISPSFQSLRLMGWAREVAGSVGEGKSLNLEHTGVHQCASLAATQTEHFHLNYKPRVAAACICL